MLSIHSDVHFMNQAILEASKAFEKGEIPVGAIIVCENQIIARAHNQTQLLNDVTAHAEMLAITAAAAGLAFHVPGHGLSTQLRDVTRQPKKKTREPKYRHHDLQTSAS